MVRMVVEDLYKRINNNKKINNNYNNIVNYFRIKMINNK